ncbi:MAG: glycosyltransferase family 2 protein [Ferruginibacter sp.]|nr:glycosyltransferase family 2 protein [Ferruginibacter sp.]
MMNNLPSISVALTTFNGGKYIEVQLASILNQSFAPTEVVICDDSSTDNTMEILEQWAKLYSVIKIYSSDKQLGVNMNFNKAISQCKGDYIALSDQDDIWELNKLENQLQDIQTLELLKGKSFPILSVHDLTMITADGIVIAQSAWKHNAGSPIVPKSSLLFTNNYNGCTMLFNKPLKNLVLPIPEKVPMHDHWIALTAFYLGRILTSETSLLNYRRHDNTVTKHKNNRLKRYLHNIFGKNYKQNEINQCKEFLSRHQKSLNPKAVRQIKSVIDLTNSINLVRKIHFSFKYRFTRLI